VELAILLPFLAFIFVVAADYSRVFYASMIVNTCARNGALYGCDSPANAADTTGIQNAALADAVNLTPTPTVTSTTGTDASGSEYVEVTVSFQFQTITNYPIIPNTVNLSRTVRMRVSPVVPEFAH
jgi:Flp pilus assembly protein TadG